MNQPNDTTASRSEDSARQVRVSYGAPVPRATEPASAAPPAMGTGESIQRDIETAYGSLRHAVGDLAAAALRRYGTGKLPKRPAPTGPGATTDAATHATSATTNTSRAAAPAGRPPMKIASADKVTFDDGVVPKSRRRKGVQVGRAVDRAFERVRDAVNQRNASPVVAGVKQQLSQAGQAVTKAIDSANAKADRALKTGSKQVGDQLGDAREAAMNVVASGLSGLRELGDQLRSAMKRSQSGTRDQVVMVRIAEDAREQIDSLVEVGLFKSRSECAAFLIDEGLTVQSGLLGEIQGKLNEIRRLKAELQLLVIGNEDTVDSAADDATADDTASADE